MPSTGSEKYSPNDTYISTLSHRHMEALSGFESDRKELNEFLARDSLEYQKLNLGITYLLFNGRDKLVSYVTLGMGALRIPDREIFVFKGRRLADYPKDFPSQFPGLLVGKLATDRLEERKGGAGILLDFAVKVALEAREKIGCAYLLAHAYLESTAWYGKKGFKTYVENAAGRETIPMYFEL